MNHNMRNSQHEAPRLTPRGEAISKFSKMALAVASGTLTIGVGAATMYEHSQENYQETLENTEKTTIIVNENETIWDIAARIAPDRDIRDVVDVIEDLNPGLGEGFVQMGTEITVPVYKSKTSSVDLDNNTARISLDK